MHYDTDPQQPNIRTALTAARRGWWVFPVEPGGKRPWNGIRWSEAATNDVAEIRRHGWPRRANVGIACGPSGLLVIDLDNHDADGVTACSNLCARQYHESYRCDRRYCVPEMRWPAAYTVETPTGGYHQYFTNPGGLGNGTGELPDGIDVRGAKGAGGYVLAAGSVLDERAYPDKPDLQAMVSGGRRYEVYDDSPVAQLPGFLNDLLRRPTRNPNVLATRVLSARCAEWGSVTIARLNGELHKIKHAAPGNRNKTLFEAACRCGEMIAIGRIDPDTAEAKLVSAARGSAFSRGEAE